MLLGTEVVIGPGDFVFDGHLAIPRKRHTQPHPIFDLCVLWPNGWMDQGATWYGCKHRPSRRCVRWGRNSPPINHLIYNSPKRGTDPQFSVHVCCGQTVGWMKTPLGTEVDLGPGNIVLEGVPALRERGMSAAPSFRPMSIVATVAHLCYC